MTEDRIFEIAELLADEVYKENGVVMYAERQELTSKFNKILVENLAIHDVVVNEATVSNESILDEPQPLYKDYEIEGKSEVELVCDHSYIEIPYPMHGTSIWKCSCGYVKKTN